MCPLWVAENKNVSKIPSSCLASESELSFLSVNLFQVIECKGVKYS